MFQRRMGRRAAFWGGELFVHRCAIARHSLLVVGQGCGLHPFAACSAAGGQRNCLSPRQVPPAAVALRNAPAGAALGAPAVFCIALCAIARHSLLVVGRVAGSNHSPPVRRRGGQRNSLSPRQVPPAAVALRNAPAGAALGAPAVFCIALCAIARHSLLVVGRVAGSNHSPPVRRRGGQRNSLSPRQVPPAAVALRNAPAGAALGAPAVFCIALCAIARHSRAGKKNTAAVKGNGCRAPCSLSGFLHHKTPCGKYLRKKYHTMVLPVTQV